MRFLILILFLAGDAWGANSFPVAKRGQPNNDWRNVGVRGGVPTVTTVNTTLAAGQTAAQINTAIGSCPSNQVVMLAASTTYNLANGTVFVNKNGVVLRGATNSFGYPTTKLINCIARVGNNGSRPSTSAWAEFSPIGISSGLTEGSTQITLSSAPNAEFSVGAMMCIDQTDDGTLVTASTTTFAHRSGRAMVQVCQITNITGSVIDFVPPLFGTYWSGSRTPQAFAFASDYGSTVMRAGLEDVEIDMGTASGLYATEMMLSVDCWYKNVVITGWPTSGGAAGCRPLISTHFTIRDCIIHDLSAVSSSSYGLYATTVSYFAIENNILTNLALGIPMVSAVCGSISYNTCLGPYPYSPSNWLPEYLFPHGGHNMGVLYEGNFVQAPIYFDKIFGGNNSKNAIIRNRLQGYWNSSQTDNANVLELEADMDDTTILGNVVGMVGFHTSYADLWPIDATCSGTIRTNNWNTFNAGIPSSETEVGGNSTDESYRFIGTDRPPFWGALATWPPFTLSSASTNLTAYSKLPSGYRVVNGRWPDSLGGSGAHKQGKRPTNSGTSRRR